MKSAEMTSTRRGRRSRTGATSAVSPDRARSTVVASPEVSPARAASIASTCSRSCTTSSAVS
jgi:hypothetical protein